MAPEKDGKDEKVSDTDLDEIKAKLDRMARKDRSKEQKEELIHEEEPAEQGRPKYPRAPKENEVPTLEMESLEQMDIIKKICLIGDSGVGKKTILGKVAPFRKEWEHYANTIGTTITKYCQSYSFVVADVKLLIMVWDITGREDFLHMQPSYYKGAEGLIVMADASDEKSIENIPKWIRAAYKITDTVPTIVVINKLDLVREEERKNLDRKVRDILKGYEVPIFYTTNTGTADALSGPFYKIAQLIGERVKLQLAKKRYKKLKQSGQ